MLATLEQTKGWLDNPWLVLGVLGQVLFGARFLVQWIATERQKRVVVPVAFWWISLVGALLTTGYGILRGEIPIILGQVAGFFVYPRNLVIHYAHLRTLPCE